MLAKIGINQGEENIRVVVPPSEVVELLKDDLKGTAFPRVFSFVIVFVFLVHQKKNIKSSRQLTYKLSYVTLLML